MSIVVAVRKDDVTAIAADTLTIFGDQQRTPTSNARSRKVMRLGSAVIGATGWGVYDDILAHYLRDRPAPELTSSRSIFAFFLDLWKALHDNYPFVNDQSTGKDSPFGDLDSTFLVGHDAGIHKVAGDLGVTAFMQYHAIGSGSEYALGAMQTLYDEPLSAEHIARRAVAAACEFDVYCGGEIDVLIV